MAYATRAELARYGGLPSHVLCQFTDAKQNDALTAATSYADGYLRTQYAVPMVSPSEDLRIKVAEIASFFLMRQLGMNPEQFDTLIVKAYDDATKWLTQIARGEVTLISTSDQTPTTDDYGPSVVTSTARGW